VTYTRELQDEDWKGVCANWDKMTDSHRWFLVAIRMADGRMNLWCKYCSMQRSAAAEPWQSFIDNRQLLMEYPK